MRDGFEQRFIGALEMVGVHLEGLCFGDKEFYFFVAGREMLDSFREIKLRRRRWDGHMNSNPETGQQIIKLWRRIGLRLSEVKLAATVWA